MLDKMCLVNRQFSIVIESFWRLCVYIKDKTYLKQFSNHIFLAIFPRLHPKLHFLFMQMSRLNYVQSYHVYIVQTILGLIGMIKSGLSLFSIGITIWTVGLPSIPPPFFSYRFYRLIKFKYIHNGLILHWFQYLVIHEIIFQK